AAIELVRQPQRDLGEDIEQHHRDQHDENEGIDALEDFVDREVLWCHTLAIEGRHRHRRSEEGGLQVQRDQNAEEQRVDAVMLQQRHEDRYEDDNDLGPLQRPTQQEDDELGQDHELGARQIEIVDQLAHHFMAVQIGKDRREGG